MSSIRAVVLVAASAGLLVGASGYMNVALQSQAGHLSPAKNAVGKNPILSELTYPQVYATPDGETHFREVVVSLQAEATAPPAQPVAQSELQAATTIRHAAFPAGWGAHDRDHGLFHNPSSARFVTVRRGVGWIRTSDGETRRFQAGDVIEVLDVAPSKGHIFWVGDEALIALYSNHR
jgi:hypothetical protein